MPKHISEIVDEALAAIMPNEAHTIEQDSISREAKEAGVSVAEYKQIMDEAHAHFDSCDLIEQQRREEEARFDFERSGGR
tara:strand:+ start:1153 stop:1392 length:240 start_codon:yes stop_codon:yes gene_type:complete